MRFDPLVDLTRASLVTAIIGLASIAAAQQDEAAFFKRSVALGLPLLADAGTPSNEHSGESGEGRRGEREESGTQYGLSDTAKEVRSGVELIVRFDGARRAFSGTVKNGTDATVRRVRVEVHLSNGAELGPTANVDLRPGQSAPVELRAGSQEFNKFSTHVEIGAGEHGGEHGGREDSEHRDRRGGEHRGREGGEH
ncbi:MAG: hypothetical protein F4Y47_05765 [Acidobacteriia bacterium]|nr:hypothetical protein [Terriglobia bacterium]MYG04051.1 hypothetical protein [Terriglobia bacterium]MYK10342.1 hypothetical protein [Terriglobia bacterium]